MVEAPKAVESHKEQHLRLAHEAYHRVRLDLEDLMKRMKWSGLETDQVLTALSMLKEADEAVVAEFGKMVLERTMKK